MQKKGDAYCSPSTLVLVAALDEEKGIGRTLAELKHYLGNAYFLVVDGNSRDGTVDVAKSFGADVLRQEGKGKGDAIACALKQVKGIFDYVVLTDADYTYPAMYVPHMIEILDKHPRLGMVCGNRFNSHLNLGNLHYLLYFGNRSIAFAHNMFNNVTLRDPLTGLRVIRWNILKGWLPKSAGFDVEVELNHRVERCGYGIAEVEIPYRNRVGEKKLKLRHGVTIMKRIITESVY